MNNKIQRAVQILACGVCAVAFAPAASAEAQPGFYIGVSAGQSSFDLDKEEFDDIVLDVFLSQGLPLISRSSTFEDSDTSLAFFAGYQILPYIAVEASYLDLGAAEYRFVGTVNPPGPVTSIPAALDTDIETKGYTISGIGSLPIGKIFDLHGRFGLFIAQTDLTVGATIASSRAVETESLDSEGVWFAVGAGFHFGQHFSLSADWTRYDNVGDDDEDDDTDGGFDIDALSLSAMFRF